MYNVVISPVSAGSGLGKIGADKVIEVYRRLTSKSFTGWFTNADVRRVLGDVMGNRCFPVHLFRPADNILKQFKSLGLCHFIPATVTGTGCGHWVFTDKGATSKLWTKQERDNAIAAVEAEGGPRAVPIDSVGEPTKTEEQCIALGCLPNVCNCPKPKGGAS